MIWTEVLFDITQFLFFAVQRLHKAFCYQLASLYIQMKIVSQIILCVILGNSAIEIVNKADAAGGAGAVLLNHVGGKYVLTVAVYITADILARLFVYRVSVCW